MNEIERLLFWRREYGYEQYIVYAYYTDAYVGGGEEEHGRFRKLRQQISSVHIDVKDLKKKMEEKMEEKMVEKIDGMNKKIEGMNKKIEEKMEGMNLKIEGIDKKFDEISEVNQKLLKKLGAWTSHN